MLNEDQLEQILHNSLSQKTDGNGVPTKTSSETKAYAAGVIAALKSAIVSNPPGTINGITSPGSPLSAGSGILGLIVMTPAPMIAKTSTSFNPLSNTQLIKENTALITYLATGIVTFSAGNITGNCTNTAPSPGPLVNGAGKNGRIVGLTGAGAYAAVFAALGFLGPDALTHYNHLVNYILDNALVSYPTSSVQGVCPAGGGPLVGGFAAGGTIS